MPMFRTSSAPDLAGAIRGTMNKLKGEADQQRRQNATRLAKAASRLFGGGDQPSAMDEIRVDQAAADTAHKLSLVDQVRAKLDHDRAAETRRSDPAEQTQYAADVAGMDTPSGTQLYKALRGVRERPPVEFDNGDESITAPEGGAANRMPDVTFAMPTLPPGQRERFQQAFAALQGSRLATGNTNAEQLAQAGGHLLKQDLMSQAANAPDVETGNKLVSAISGHLRAPFKTDAHGITTNTETGAVNEGGDFARGNIALIGRKADSERALAGERGAHAKLHGKRAEKIDREISGADDGQPAQQFRSLTGAKLSDLTPEARLAWMQNHAKGMDPLENLVSLTATGGKRDVLMQEARQVYETQYPKTIMGQRDPRAPNFLDFADQYVQLKEGGQRTPRPDAPGRNAQGRIKGPGEPQAQQVARPKSQADFDALPKGAVYIDPDDGKSYRKR